MFVGSVPLLPVHAGSGTACVLCVRTAMRPVCVTRMEERWTAGRASVVEVSPMQLQPFENYAEKRVRRVLNLAVDRVVYRVNSQTPIESVIKAEGKDPADERSMVRNGSFDFTIHRESAFTPLWAVEYDGPDHDHPPRIRDDIVKNRVCGKVNLPLLRIGHREDDDFLTANERLTALEWLIRRWIKYEKEIGGLIRDNERWLAELTSTERAQLTYEDVSAEYHFGLANPYPPLRAIANRLLKRHGVEVDMLSPRNEVAAADVRWRASSPTMGPLPDLGIGGFLTGHECEVEVRAVGTSEADIVFATRETFAARFAYPVRPGQRSPFDLKPPYTAASGAVLCGPPWGGSPARIGGEIAWYRALKQVERWAEYQPRA